MRLLILISGAGLLIVAAAYLLLAEAVAIFTIPVSVIVVILGWMTPPPTKVTGGKAESGSTWVIVDRAVLGASIYQLFFFNTRLILKRIATAKTTVFSIVVLAVVGFASPDGLLGALAGVAAGYALQEYTTQARRLKSSVLSDTLTLGAGDVEVPYEDLEEVRIDKNRLVLFSKRGITKIGLSRGYGVELAPRIKKLLPGKFKDEESVHSPNASREQDE